MESLDCLTLFHCECSKRGGSDGSISNTRMAVWPSWVLTSLGCFVKLLNAGMGGRLGEGSERGK